MSFRAVPAAMRRAATELDASADDAATFRAYAAKYSEVADEGMGRFADVARTHREFFAELTETLAHLRTVLSDSQIELHQAATYYEQADAQTAADLDATLPAAPRPTYHDSLQPGPGSQPTR
ncbi:type VII secretion target [Cryptosporangium minutisporangium]|uniref:ESX-1 secretion-associated protein n=1 Tax=Cryptosporangium minutisporangium TaxID=113569 RepID=A0ABP6T6Z6_9ACTN